MLDPLPNLLACQPLPHRYMQESLSKPFLVLLESATVKDLCHMQDAISAKLSAIARENEEVVSHPTATSTSTPKEVISSVVQHVDDLSLDDSLVEGIESDLHSLQLQGSNPKKVLTQWLSPSVDSYNYGKIVNKPRPIGSFPHISALMDIINRHPDTSNDMDACLVSFYPSCKASLSLHKDDEELISQSSSICTISFGAPRDLEFVLDGKKKKGKKKGSKALPDLTADLSLPATHLSMNIMKPGAQSLMKHRVKAGTPPLPDQSDIRYSLSFRRITRVAKDEDAIFSSPAAAEDLRPKPKPKKNVVLIAGDSFPARLDASRLGKGKKDVRNISVGGSKITKVQKSIEEFVHNEPDVEVKKLFVSIGTNDIRHCTNGIKHLKNSVCDLMKRIRELLPLATVFFQSIPPIHPNGCPHTVKNVIFMNKLIFDLCSRFKLFYLDILVQFLNKYGYRNDSLFPKYDAFRKSFDIHPNAKGYGILAKCYIYLIHSRRFNPLGY
jgi:alkylated DNA repair dioxygenase AlkB